MILLDCVEWFRIEGSGHIENQVDVQTAVRLVRTMQGWRCLTVAVTIIGVRGSPERDILSLGAMGPGPG